MQKKLTGNSGMIAAELKIRCFLHNSEYGVFNLDDMESGKQIKASNRNIFAEIFKKGKLSWKSMIKR